MFSQEYHGSRDARGTLGYLAFFQTWNWSGIWKENKKLLTAAALGVAGAVAVWLFQRVPVEDDAFQDNPRGKDAVHVNKPKELDSASLHKILDELTRRFFKVARDVAVVSRDIREKLKKQGQDDRSELEEKALQSQITSGCQVAEKFSVIRAQLLKEYNITEETVAQLSNADSETVLCHQQRVAKMLEDALVGLMPILQGVEIPKELTEDKLLEVNGHMLQLKIDKIKHLAAATDGKRFPPEELGRAAAMMSQAAEEEVFVANQSLLGKDGAYYHSVLAELSRNPEFSKRMAAREAEHRRALIAAFRGER